MDQGPPSRRRKELEHRLRAAQSATGLGTGGAKIYGLVLLLLALLFVMLTYSGRAPRVLEKVFPPQDPLTPAQQQERRQRLQEQLGGALFDPADGADFVDTPGYRRLLSSFFQATEPTDKVVPFDRDLVLRDPDAQRGQRVVLQGFTGRNGVWAYRLNPPLLRPGGQLTDVWRMVLTDGERDDGAIVDVIDDPGNIDVTRDEFRVEAVFWRIVKYEVDAGTQPDGKPRKAKWREAPYLIARSVTRIDDSANSIGGISRPMFVFFSLLMAGMTVFGIYRILAQHRRSSLRAAVRTPSFKSPPGSSPSRGDGPPT